MHLDIINNENKTLIQLKNSISYLPIPAIIYNNNPPIFICNLECDTFFSLNPNSNEAVTELESWFSKKLYQIQNEEKIQFYNKNNVNKSVYVVKSNPIPISENIFCNIFFLIDITLYNKELKSLIDQTLYFKNFMEQSTDCIYFKDKRSRFLTVNKGFFQKHNLNDVDCIGKTDFDLFGPLHATEAFNDEQSIIALGLPLLNKEEKEDCKNGIISWVSTNKMPLKDSNGDIIGTFGISRDITKLKENELEREDVIKFEKLISKVSSIFIKNSFSNFTNAILQALKEIAFFVEAGKASVYYLDEKINCYSLISNYPSNTASDSNFSFDDFKYWYDTLKNEKFIFSIKNDLLVNKYKLEYEFLSSNNSESILILPLINYTSLVGFIFFFFNNSDNHWVTKYSSLINILSELLSHAFSNNEAEKYRLEAEEEMLKLLRAVNQSSDAIIIMDKNGLVEYINFKYTEFTGYSFEEVIGKVPSFLNTDFNTIWDIPAVWNKISKGIVHSQLFHEKTKDGNWYWGQVSLTPIKSMKGELTNILALIQDVTEKVVNENRKAVSQKLESIGQLAAGIAHEINTPMQFIGDNNIFLKNSINDIKTYIEELESIINNPPLSSSDSKSILNNTKVKYDIEYLLSEIPLSIEQSGSGIQRVSEIIKAMKDFAHPGNKEKSFSNINQGIEVTTTISKNEWKYVAEVILDLDDNLPLCYCHQDEINQVILNMIINSSHAINDRNELGYNDKGIIKISTKKIDDNIQINITDNGKGISEENITKIFDPFFTTKEVGKGTGQGLAIAHDIIVNKHYGSINVFSIPFNETVFTINLPIHYSKNE